MPVKNTYSLTQVETLLNAKTNQLTEIQAAQLETNILTYACEKHGKQSPQYANFFSEKQSTGKELGEIVDSLRYQIYILEEMKREIKDTLVKKTLGDLVRSSLLTEKQSIRFAKEILRTVDDLNGVKTMRLLYNSSRDGFDARTFHEKCDNQGATVVLIKATTGAVFGGYTKTGWKLNAGSDMGAFLFSLISANKEERFRILRQLPQEYGYMFSISSDPNSGPIFGRDLVISDKANQNAKSSSNPEFYEKLGSDYLAGSKWFTVETMEAYRFV